MVQTASSSAARSTNGCRWPAGTRTRSVAPFTTLPSTASNTIAGSSVFEAVLGNVVKGATLRVLVPAGHLHPFVERAAEDEAVWTIDPWYLPRILNDNSVWVIQSYDTTNKLNYALS